MNARLAAGGLDGDAERRCNPPPDNAPHGMDPCNECGNTAVLPKFYDGHSVLECDLCGALSGGAHSVATIELAREAQQEGVDAPVFALRRALEAMEGLRVVDSHGGDRARRRLPFVRWIALDPRAFMQLENLAKSLRLSSGSTSMPWTIEVEFQSGLEFVLTPRVATSRPREADVALAQADLSLLGRAFARDVRLSWWRRA